jgi:Na+-translocating ferredoxin:NAD+ oxidoreductase RnfC subunit
MCPRGLLGYPLEPHKMVRTAMNAAKVSPMLVRAATLCCGCGVCENLACSQGISPKAVINNYKALLAENKLRYSTDSDVEVTREREYRMIPSERWEQTLGVAKYDVVPEYLGSIRDFGRVEIALNRHIGAPSVPAVNSGDVVSVGDKIADAAGGLSVPQHASIGGRAHLYDNKIIIDRI